MASVRCPKCRTMLKVASAAAGKKIRCAKCDVLVSLGGEDLGEEAGVESRVRARSGSRGDDEGERRRGRDGDDDDDDRRRSRSARDEEEDDRPRKRSARERDEDDRPRRRQAAKGGKGLLIGLIAGGAVVLIGLVVGAVLLFSKGGGSSSKEGQLIVGLWEGVDGPLRNSKVEFTRDGKYKTTTIFTENTVTYRVVSATELEVGVPEEVRKVAEALVKMMGKGGSVPSTMTVTMAVSDNELTLTPPKDGPFGDPLAAATRYRRIGGNQPPQDKGGDKGSDKEKTPPKTEPLAKAIVGKWEGTSLSVMNRTVEFTADGKFIEDTWSRSRRYVVVGSKIEMDIIAQEKTSLADLAKLFKGLKIPTKWVYRVTVTENELTMQVEGDIQAISPAPGGPFRVTYRRVSTGK